MTPYIDIARGVAFRANLVDGGDATTREAAFVNANLSSVMDSPAVPYSELRDDILMVEAKIWESIGNSTTSTLRAALLADSDPIASGDDVPFESADAFRFFGVFDGAFDAGDNEPLDEIESHILMARINNPNSFFVCDSYTWCKIGTKVFTARPSIYFRGIAWDKTFAKTEYDAARDSYLPYSLASLWIAMVLARLPREKWFVPEGEYYARIAESEKSDVIEGKNMLVLPDLIEKASRPDPGRG